MYIYTTKSITNATIRTNMKNAFSIQTHIFSITRVAKIDTHLNF